MKSEKSFQFLQLFPQPLYDAVVALLDQEEVVKGKLRALRRGQGGPPMAPKTEQAPIKN